MLGAEAVNGIQAEGVISTLKHYSLNCNETSRHWLDAIIDPAAHRESDLLAFQIAIERSHPGAIMSGYNRVNGEYAGGNKVLLQDVLKDAFGYRGWVMSDWGATPSWEFALAGLGQESGVQLDTILWGSQPFTEPLRKAYTDGEFPKARLSEMARRILRSITRSGLTPGTASPRSTWRGTTRSPWRPRGRGSCCSRTTARCRLGPMSRSRSGSSAATLSSGCPAAPVRGRSCRMGFAAVLPIGGQGPMGASHNLFLMPSWPLTELKKLLPNAQIDFDPAESPAGAELLAKRSDVVIAFGIRVEGESFDLADLSLPWGQDAVIDAVATANPNTIVVLETGNPTSMPWRDKVRAIVQAWYPGQAGGQAIAEILTGTVNPSGRLPITFPADLTQTPRPELPGMDTPWGTPTTIEYHEGAEVGYRWYTRQNSKPMYAFGHGLSYTSFDYRDLQVSGGAG